MFLNLAAGEGGVGFVFLVLVTLCLNLPGGLDPFPNLIRTLGSRAVIAKFRKRYRRDFYVEVNPVQERAGEFTAVLGNPAGRAVAGLFGMTEVAARADLRCLSVKLSCEPNGPCRLPIPEN